ncbi:MAG: SIS domain-containing protein [Candidatus Odinarchaeia archaeon]
MSSNIESETKQIISSIIERINRNIESIDETQVEKMVNEIIYTKAKGGKIFVAGTGRTGLVGKAFAMRLYHLGFDVVIVGETIVPSATKRDCVIAMSGSGKTDFTVDTASIAKRIGTRVIALTSNKNSPLAELADTLVIVKGRTKDAVIPKNEKSKTSTGEKNNSELTKIKWDARQLTGLHAPLSPLGSLFELTLMMFLEGIIATLIHRLKIEEEDIKSRHANIETISY